jgi:hypothetical protein
LTSDFTTTVGGSVNVEVVAARALGSKGNRGQVSVSSGLSTSSSWEGISSRAQDTSDSETPDNTGRGSEEGAGSSGAVNVASSGGTRQARPGLLSADRSSDTHVVVPDEGDSGTAVRLERISSGGSFAFLFVIEDGDVSGASDGRGLASTTSSVELTTRATVGFGSGVEVNIETIVQELSFFSGLNSP